MDRFWLVGGPIRILFNEEKTCNLCGQKDLSYKYIIGYRNFVNEIKYMQLGVNCASLVNAIGQRRYVWQVYPEMISIQNTLVWFPLVHYQFLVYWKSYNIWDELICGSWLIMLSRSLNFSIGEIEEVIGSIIISSHTIATESIYEQESRPGHSDVASVEVVDEPTLDWEFAESTEHVVEV